jgi:hypothetical protein
VPACSHCGEPLDARSVTALPGPGAADGEFGRTRLSEGGQPGVDARDQAGPPLN